MLFFIVNVSRAWNSKKVQKAKHNWIVITATNGQDAIPVSISSTTLIITVDSFLPIYKVLVTTFPIMAIIREIKESSVMNFDFDYEFWVLLSMEFWIQLAFVYFS